MGQDIVGEALGDFFGWSVFLSVTMVLPSPWGRLAIGTTRNLVSTFDGAHSRLGLEWLSLEAEGKRHRWRVAV